MAINASGIISIGGSAGAGASVALELGLSGTAQLGLNCAAPRALAGIPSGVISLSNFYGKSNSTGPTTGIYYGGQNTCQLAINRVTRINSCGALIGSTTTAGTARFQNAGAELPCSRTVFYGGSYRTGGYIHYPTLNTVTRINKCGAIVGSEGTAGRSCGTATHGGVKAGSNGLFYGGFAETLPGCYYFGCATNSVVRINKCGAQVGSTTTAGTKRYYVQGVGICCNANFFASGRYSCVNTPCCSAVINKLTKINNCGALVSETCVPSGMRVRNYGGVAAKAGSVGVFAYGQADCDACTYKKVDRLNKCGAVVGSVTTVGTGTMAGAAAQIGSNAVVYGGYSGGYTNKATRINACGAQVGICTTVSTAQYGHGAASTS
jgi:hypothetical protein